MIIIQEKIKDDGHCINIILIFITKVNVEVFWNCADEKRKENNVNILCSRMPGDLRNEFFKSELKWDFSWEACLDKWINGMWGKLKNIQKNASFLKKCIVNYDNRKTAPVLYILEWEKYHEFPPHLFSFCKEKFHQKMCVFEFHVDNN